MSALVFKLLSPAECAAVAKHLRLTGKVAQAAKDLGQRTSFPPPHIEPADAAQEPALYSPELQSGGPRGPRPNQPLLPAESSEEPASPDHCPTCGAGEFAEDEDRITVIYPAGYGIVVPCPECRHEAAWAAVIRMKVQRDMYFGDEFIEGERVRISGHWLRENHYNEDDHPYFAEVGVVRSADRGMCVVDFPSGEKLCSSANLEIAQGGVRS